MICPLFKGSIKKKKKQKKNNVVSCLKIGVNIFWVIVISFHNSMFSFLKSPTVFLKNKITFSISFSTTVSFKTENNCSHKIAPSVLCTRVYQNDHLYHCMYLAVRLLTIVSCPG